MKRLAEGIGTVWVSPEGGGLNMVAFHEGDEVPAWAAKQMGDHCFKGLPGTEDEPAGADDDNDPSDDLDGDTGQDTDESPSDDSDADTEDEQNGAEQAPDYESWVNADLEAEIAKRNKGRGDDDVIEVEGRGIKADLVAALVADDANASAE